MSTPPVPLRMVEVSGAEALWLIEGSSSGRLVYMRRDLPTVRPARHVWEYGRLVVRTPVPAAAVPATAAYHVDEIRAVHGTGWTVTASGPAEVITDPDEAAHYRRTLSGWTHGPHDTLLRLHPRTVTGFRLARAEA
ncbi:pyridoxamine 5'-phosphate oxidase family protein [Streptomyces caniscabiei]|uniref:Pyridoxamine 5'-phosphate oxidase family protein n=1 Tax=Streptomyces caniscabiei TaxID=2746961 RepID=A0A927QJT5_9ACTN|nr:pyridoxamine 5'-phosphate oxidase family protein [Streptomyces caniscabiei]MBD9729883.1 pyridoxamine 5'-phosphate oxidase family protein [Streptomyces caniscabiei]MDX3515596.1 pyridoxamine 5'-phosphate oxidase family protein [Streptomyces caniscabiei]MDX3724852.1 pyridoxamine 5'-phosphate oxidase family protein [Streptomyces caniscabiei]MDX3733507.1 pyridoxamine 5'-phosphate oxidase family protein [Streptomyces caniscabiei]WEO21760.1 pyridoxamine 5'-phosphate oxidase family protein [Strepto